MNADSTSPNTKIASARVPEVPDDYVEQPFSRRRLVWRLLSYPVVLVGLILCVVWRPPAVGWTLGMLIHTAPSVSKPVVQIGTALSVSTPDVLVDCPNRPSPPSDGRPTLFFCSPEYQGDVAGPFGARIVLVGENFSSPPTKWFLPKQPIEQDDPLKECAPDAQKTNCLLLSNPPPKQVQPGVFVFSWIWQAPFPSMKGDYFITAQMGNQLVTTAPKLFTLLSSQPPCVTIAAVTEKQTQTEQKPGCPQQKVPLKQGTSISIQGKNWLLGWKPDAKDPLNMQVKVVADCISPSSCSRAQLFDVTVPSDKLLRNGTFSLSQNLLSDVKGKYAVRAWNKTRVNGSPGGKENTTADRALLFGEKASDLVLEIA